MPGIPVLIVEDNPINLKLARVLLTLEGYDVYTAVDAEEAMAMIANARPRLILMDLQLPGLDGLTLIRQLKADPKTRDIVILSITAYAMKGDKLRAWQAVCDGYVAKPVDNRARPGILTKAMRNNGEKPPRN